MAAKYQLAYWRPARDLPAVNTLTRQPAGFIVHCYGGWIWTHAGREYRTDSEGKGIWVRGNDGTWHQSAGTGQFHLPNNRQEALRILRREGYAPDQVAPYRQDNAHPQ